MVTTLGDDTQNNYQYTNKINIFQVPRIPHIDITPQQRN